MGDTSFANTDTRIPKAIMGAISKNLPLRLHLIALCRPMWFLYILFPVVRLFLAKKLQGKYYPAGWLDDWTPPTDAVYFSASSSDRIHNIGGDPTLLGKAPFLLKMDLLPARLSGSNFAYNHQEKVAQWKADEEQRIANHSDEKTAEVKWEDDAETRRDEGRESPFVQLGPPWARDFVCWRHRVALW